MGYYLSQIDAGQKVDSPAVNAADVDANDPVRGFDPHIYTTRTDGVGDFNAELDLGYHYSATSRCYLVVQVVDKTGQVVTDVNEMHGYVVPHSGSYPSGAVVPLVAYPDRGYQVVAWSGTDYDPLVDPNNRLVDPNNKTVTMTANRIVTVCFGPPARLTVKVIGVGTVDVDPDRPAYYAGKQVRLTAHPAPGYRVKAWTGTDVAPAWNENINVVSIRWTDVLVTVEFELDTTHVITVPGDYPGHPGCDLRRPARRHHRRRSGHVHQRPPGRRRQRRAVRPRAG